MISIIFLGTGPVRGRKGKGRNRRRESSIILRVEREDFLFDVGRDFDWQKKFIKKLKAVFITHAHRDAIGGIAKLKGEFKKRKLEKPISLWAHQETIKHIKKNFKNTEEYLNYNKVKTGETIKIGKLQVFPFLVPHSIQSGFPTFAFKIKINRKKIVYASDVGALVPKLIRAIEDTNLLIIDGAMWKKKIKSHLEVTSSLPELCKAKVGKIYLTQIGRTTPPHEVFKKKVRKICSKAKPAYDGLKIDLVD